MPAPQINTVMFDTLDPAQIAEFWMALLDVEVRHEDDDYIFLDRQRPGGVSLAFQRVPDPTPGKNKLHVDGSCDDLDEMRERIESLGGRHVDTHHAVGFVWGVFADPDGNLFCLGHPTDGD